MPTPAPLQQRSLHELREAFMNARLADSWDRGEGWARLDLAGVELQAGSAVQHQQKLQKVCEGGVRNLDSQALGVNLRTGAWLSPC